MKYLLLTIIVLLTTFSFAEEEVNLPYAIRSAEKTLVRDVDRALKDYNDAVKKAAERYAKVLEKELKDAMRDGDLKLANAINKKKKSIEDLKAAAAAMKTITFDAKPKDNKETPSVGNLVIHKALWGYQDKTADVTSIIKGQVKDGKLSMDLVRDSRSLNMPDPAPGMAKSLILDYTLNGERKTATFHKDTPFTIGNSP